MSRIYVSNFPVQLWFVDGTLWWGLVVGRKVQLHFGQMMMNGIKMGDQVQPMVRCNPGSRWAFCTSPCYRPRSARTFPSITLTSDLLSLKLVQRENVGPNVMFNVNMFSPSNVHSVYLHSTQLQLIPTPDLVQPKCSTHFQGWLGELCMV